VRARDARNWTRGLGVGGAISGALTAAVLAFSAAAVAAPVPGTPDPVAAGVPGYGRAWELVTPPDVSPARIIGYPLIRGISPSGDRLIYNVAAALQDTSYGGIFTSNLAQRSPGGWTSTALVEPEPKGSGILAIVLGSEGLVAVDPEVEDTLWVNSLPSPQVGQYLYAAGPDGAYRPLVDMGASGSFRYASDDLRRAFFATSDHLLPADAPRSDGSRSPYEYFEGTLRPVDVKDDGTLVSNCGSTLEGTSTDGERAFFSARPECGAIERVYMRAGGHTTEISASQCTLPDPECGAEANARFAGATPSGSAVYISTPQRLTNDDANEYQDLYRYDTSSGELTLLTPRPAASTASPGGFVVKPSDDGSRAFLAAEAQLIPGEGAATGSNLYLADGQGLSFVAPLADSRFFQTSTDGRYVLFATSTQLAPGDTDESADLYRYDVNTGQYLQVSAGLGGSGNGAFAVEGVGRRDIGQQVFFTTAEPLVPQDHNELGDVYEWTEAGGLALISAGTPGFKAEYAGGTPDARTVLFTTGATLIPGDRDGGEVDIYAARVGGGFPEPAAPAGCGTGGACDASSAGTPHRTLPGASGPGKPFIGIAPIDAAARRQLVAKGMTTLLLEVPAAGRLTAQGRARVGAHPQTVATGATVAKAAGPVRLRLRLTQAARRSLAHGHDLRVRLAVRLAARKAMRNTDFVLEGAR
jgi:hypothetical protein